MSTEHQHPVRTERCACGGSISVVGDDALDITDAVMKHQRTSKHEEWRRMGGLRYDREWQGRR